MSGQHDDRHLPGLLDDDDGDFYGARFRATPDFEQALDDYRRQIVTVHRIPILAPGEGLIFVTSRSIWQAQRRRKRSVYRYVRQSERNT